MKRCLDATTSSATQTAFRKAEKRYKLFKQAGASATDFSSVVDFAKLDDNTLENRKRIAVVNSEESIFALKDVPGLYVILDALNLKEQVYWASQSLLCFPNPPNVTNLTQSHPSEKDFFMRWVSAGCPTSSSRKKQTLLEKLRWATLGYHYNWTTRKYDPSQKSPFPQDLATASSILAGKVGIDNFHAEAAIINYYHADSYLCGHLDDAEMTPLHPLVSFRFHHSVDFSFLMLTPCSLGCSCVFLIGNETRDTDPTALFLRSGDALIMSGESRKYFHG